MIQKENGISYSYDFTKSMFSRGNISEKIRFSKFNVYNEVIVDFFVGMGYWVLQLSKTKPPKSVYCIDLNPNQITALETNIKLNKRDPRKGIECVLIIATVIVPIKRRALFSFFLQNVS